MPVQTYTFDAKGIAWWRTFDRQTVTFDGTDYTITGVQLKPDIFADERITVNADDTVTLDYDQDLR